MLYHQTLIDCSPDGDSGGLEFGFVVTFEDPVTREPRSETVTMSVDEMLAAPTAQLTKAEAVLAYANAMQDVWGLTWEDRAGFLESVREEIAGVSEIAADPDIVEIVSLLDQAEAQS